MRSCMALESKDRQYIVLSLRIIADFGAIIAVPIVVLAFIGKYLDTKWGTKPWLLITGFILAFVLSAFMIKRKATQYGIEYQSLGTKSDTQKIQDKKEL